MAGRSRRGTRINPGDGSNPNPLRGVTDKEASRILRRVSEGKPVDEKVARRARSAAVDHYANELNNDSKAWWKRRG